VSFSFPFDDRHRIVLSDFVVLIKTNLSLISFISLCVVCISFYWCACVSVAFHVGSLHLLFCQVSPDGSNLYTSIMSTTITGLPVGSWFQLSFYLGVRAAQVPTDPTSGYITTDTLIVTLGSTVLYSSQPNITDNNGWTSVQGAPFIVTSASAVLSFTVTSLAAQDHAIDITSVSLLPSPGSATVNMLLTFESPAISSYTYNPVNQVLNPWVWTPGAGGIGVAGSPWTPSGTLFAEQPPSPNQFAYMQTSSVPVSNMSCFMTGLTSQSQYTLSFYLATRGGFYQNSTDQLFVYLGNQLLYQSVANYSDLSGWAYVSTVFTYTGTQSTASFVFSTVNSITGDDRTLLVDSVLIQSIGYQAPQAQVTVSGSGANVISNFASPSLNGSTYGPNVTLQSYIYSPPITSSQPFTFAQIGGIAMVGGPWDPVNPSLAPSLQYAFIQVCTVMSLCGAHTSHFFMAQTCSPTARSPVML